MLAKHIVPALGKLKVADVERKHILAFQYELREKPTVANRALEMLIKMFNLAEAWELRPPGRNPCRYVRRYKVQAQHERFLTSGGTPPAWVRPRRRTGRSGLPPGTERRPSGSWC